MEILLAEDWNNNDDRRIAAITKSLARIDMSRRLSERVLELGWGEHRRARWEDAVNDAFAEEVRE
eukprot:CAMPEP_0170180504 /NCGR_PEP_ID=MMETSP0040_2-20121228/22103_1 /TAXON_ID=641309 /ORGANISM="Lotharella oceanica, Strain CCMP622" /LENGTH=64 /DNA_ID=CAMNT_0010425159 /DNA_START=143 /DNA_END=337 /DNA_ORIENTATION=+